MFDQIIFQKRVNLVANESLPNLKSTPVWR